ncbi:MAG: hypothetical protein INR65_19105 [Gluconacetobacter diazotrophicus]|nr:hypothetical protein [Gluconacetobacter diazotrophicus]
MKLAMAVGTKRHYRLDEIHGRHFAETARLARMPDALIRRAVEEVSAGCEAAFEHAASSLPADFPGEIHDITRRAALDRLRRLNIAVDD